MTTYDIPGVVMMKVGDEIAAQISQKFSIDLSDIHVTRSFQPSTQYAGARDTAAKYQIFVSPVAPSGSIGGGFKDSLNEQNEFEREFIEVVPAVFQIGFLADFNPTNPSDLEAVDIANAARNMIMQLDAITNLTNLGIFISSATIVRPPFTITSEAEFESTPNFDLSLTYNSGYIKRMPVIESIDGSTTNI